MKDKIVHCVDEPLVHSTAANIIEYFVNKDIHIAIDKSEEYGTYYDLNTGMKSHAHVVFLEDMLEIHKRYDTIEYVSMNRHFDDVIDQICWAVKDCLCGRDYLSSAWESILVDGGYLKKQVETTTKVSYK